MIFTIITHVPHGRDRSGYFAYAPYVREMNIWLKYVDQVIIVAPITDNAQDPIQIPYQHPNIVFVAIPQINFQSFGNIVKSVFHLPEICSKIYSAMKSANHIHLRCPGNIGLLGSLVQTFFPKTRKTAKYAGNWDPASSQPLSYKIQKYILNSTTISKNLKVLVYGEWPRSSANVKSFFTASYYETERRKIVPRPLIGTIKFIFAGSLSSGKRPQFAIELIQMLIKMGYDASLEFYGDGQEKSNLITYIAEHQLADHIILKGNQTADQLKTAYQSSHFLILPSVSEGWPKVVAEAMFWGCVPLSSNVSCTPFMLGEGSRGYLLEIDVQKDAMAISKIIADESLYQEMSVKGAAWSQNYTLDSFDREVAKLLTT